MIKRSQISQCVSSGPIPLASRISAGQEGWTVYFSIYLDESGKTHKGDYTSLCGYVGTNDEWARLSNAWDNLKVRWDVPPIHMSKIMRDWDKEPKKDKHEWGKKYEEVRDIWEDWRPRMLEDFANLIFYANIACVGAVVDTDAYRRVKLDPSCYLFEQDSSVYALQMAITMALDRVQRIDRNPSVQLIIDDDEEHAFDYYERLRYLRQMFESDRLPSSLKPRFERMHKYIHGISFFNDRFHPPLQAADMISYVARDIRVQEKRNMGKPNSLYGFLTQGHLNRPKEYTEDWLFRIARSTKQKIEAIRDEENCAGI